MAEDLQQYLDSVEKAGVIVVPPFQGDLQEAVRNLIPEAQIKVIRARNNIVGFQYLINPKVNRSKTPENK